MESWIGKPVRRREDPTLLTGSGRYAADPSPPGTVCIALRREASPPAWRPPVSGWTLELLETAS